MSEKLLKVGQEVWVLYGRGHISEKKLTKTTVTKVGRKYFEIDKNGDDSYIQNNHYYLEFNPNGYFYNSEKHCGHSSHVYLTEQEALMAKNGHELKKRFEKLRNVIPHDELIKLLEKYGC